MHALIMSAQAKPSGQEQRTRLRSAALLAVGVLLCWMVPPLQVSAQPEQALYFCPDRSPDQQYSATKGPGCEPLVQKEEIQEELDVEEFPSVEVSDMQQEVSRFLQRYRTLIQCCATDPSALEQVKQLEIQAVAILDAAQSGLFSEQMKLRGFTLKELLPPVARAQHQLANLRGRLQEIKAALDQLPELGFEEAGRERLRIQQLQEATQADLGVPELPIGPATGLDIQDSTLPTRLGPGTQDTTLPNTTGTAISPGPQPELQPRTGTAVGETPKTGSDIGQTPDTGFEIGTTGRVGPGIGDSSLNQPSR